MPSREQIIWCEEDHREPLRQSLISHILTNQDHQMERVLRLRRAQQEAQQTPQEVQEAPQEAPQEAEQAQEALQEVEQEALQEAEQEMNNQNNEIHPDSERNTNNTISIDSIVNTPISVQEISDCFF